jgi:hypothetical protein
VKFQTGNTFAEMDLGLNGSSTGWMAKIKPATPGTPLSTSATLTYRKGSATIKTIGSLAISSDVWHMVSIRVKSNGDLTMFFDGVSTFTINDVSNIGPIQLDELMRNQQAYGGNNPNVNNGILGRTWLIGQALSDADHLAYYNNNKAVYGL